MQGIVKTITAKGYGFISSPQLPGHLFFHAVALRGGLTLDTSLIGQLVEFELEDSPKGPRAKNVRKANGDDAK